MRKPCLPDVKQAQKQRISAIAAKIRVKAEASGEQSFLAALSAVSGVSAETVKIALEHEKKDAEESPEPPSKKDGLRYL